MDEVVALGRVEGRGRGEERGAFGPAVELVDGGEADVGVSKVEEGSGEGREVGGLWKGK